MPDQKKRRARKAVVGATLVFYDTVQLLALKTFRTNTMIIGVAVPDSNADSQVFFATTVSESDWNDYFQGKCDLRYLYEYPSTRLLYKFEEEEIKENIVSMKPVNFKEIPKEWMPEARFFSSDHTEEYNHFNHSTGVEELYVDGSWNMEEFGKFNKRFSELYNFIHIHEEWNEIGVTSGYKNQVTEIFSNKPYRGGGSYVGFFGELPKAVPQSERSRLKSIEYASPGKVEIYGEADVFEDIENVISKYLDNKNEIISLYRKLHGYLSQMNLLTVPGSRFSEGNNSKSEIKNRAVALCGTMGFVDFNSIYKMSSNNTLVASKIILAYCRRVEEAAKYFSQARVSYK